ncbi:MULTISPECIES: extracellular solute-binding protein [Sphaerochaeta]|jgi:multiple sugar transport system substrate-binding protein|uniref:ABC transporter-binding protein n=1 Tax=bioreactor metagenome TaxID=1076179 RepID=A0A644WV85_9ZZZZ|nr:MULTISPECIES: extracellular solute-binding protein [Sphaerochaeta]MDD2394401.1 extracellular solute-binding protein [Sphaerochaeta sp.]MDD3424718.1 extracellular solute-binding protein [Sphaerochaeta sp.]MDD3456127.1 extracellular solute-binding protein [Sphaerochaeta sp.]MDD4039128.1 extracellular solute-binding protein [Sphaerochaeta sp.]MDD4450322.1 extracellular solute-binding protein [Sphaerochaeta sp.]
MKKVVVFLLVLAMLSASVFAAGKTEAAPAGPVTLKVANYALLESGYEPFWKQVKVDFEAANPDITIEWVTAPYGEIVNQVVNMAGGGNKVDVIFGEIDWVPGLVDAGLAAPVRDILPQAFVDDFYPDVLKSFEVEGKPYGIPLYVSPYVLYYNKNLFTQAGLDPNKPPKTYDEMLSYAQKLSQLKDANGNKVYAFGQTTASVPVSGASLTAMVFNFGGQVLDAQGKLAVDNQGFKDAFTMVQKLDQLGYNPQNAKLKDLRNLFALGQLAMYYDQSWGFNGVKSINPDAVNFTASAEPLKGGNGVGASLLQAHCFILVDNGAARKAALSKFVEFVISEQTLSSYLRDLTPAYPAKKSMATMESVVNNGILKGASPAAGRVQVQSFIPRISNLNLELCSLAQAVTVGKQDVAASIEKFKNTASVKISQ